MEELEKWFEKRGFMSIICNWADALFTDSNYGINIEIIIIKDDNGKEYYRAFCAGKDYGVLMSYYHSFIKNEEELDLFIQTCITKKDTHN